MDEREQQSQDVDVATEMHAQTVGALVEILAPADQHPLDRLADRQWAEDEFRGLHD